MALLVFGIIVIFHEFGHFIVAKKNGIVVEEFAVGMGPKLFGVRRGETEYTLRLLPLGGACMMLGEDTAEEVDSKLHQIMTGIHDGSAAAAEKYGLGYNLVAGANIVGFQKVADAMMAQGICW